MGFISWLGNRAVSTSGRSSITVEASDPVYLDREIMKMERKGYVRAGNPYTATTHYGKTTFYQSMVLTKEAMEQTTPVAAPKTSAPRKPINKKKIAIVISVLVLGFLLFIGITAISSHIRFMQWQEEMNLEDQELRTRSTELRNRYTR